MKTNVICLAYLAAIAAAELITVLVSPLGGIIFYFVILSVLILNSSIAEQHPSQRFFLALGLVPLIRILSLSVTFADVSQIYWYLAIAAPLLVGVLAVIVTLKLRPQEIGFRGDLSSFQVVIALPHDTSYKIPLGKISMEVSTRQILIALTGIGIGLIQYFILKPEPLISNMTVFEFIAAALVLLVCTGFIEELAFRGVMQRTATEMLGSWGWIFVAVLFSLFQIWHRSALDCLFVLAVAVFFGWSVKKTGSILGVSLSHGLASISLYLIFPFVFQVSG